MISNKHHLSAQPCHASAVGMVVFLGFSGSLVDCIAYQETDPISQ